MTIRFAKKEELPQINLLRAQVNALHTAGKPEIFRPGFPPELRDYVYAVWGDPDKDILVAEEAGALLGFAILHRVHRPETPFMYPRDYLDVDEFGVDAAHRRQGIGTALVNFLRDYARAQGFDRVELNMWEFNREALAFYEAAGFTTYRRYLEMKLS